MRGLAIIVGFQLLGEALVRLAGFPFPGPVLGLVLLWIGLLRGWVLSESVEKAAGFLLENLTLLFTPVVVGAIVYRDLFVAHWLAIGLSLILSTSIGLIVTGKVAQWLEKVGTR
ncbi:MAG: CidA/LrgA family protein [Firmicutes bacterium]|nr:CidA/LrgA family protein [Bacillota bacterium]